MSTPQARQERLVERYGILPDAQERLAAIISRKQTLPEVPEESRTPEHLVQGCQSRVWIIARVQADEAGEPRCHFELTAESALVRGLVSLLCEIYSGATPGEIEASEPTVLEALGITRNLTPTRLNGVAAVRQHLVALARSSQ